MKGEAEIMDELHGLDGELKSFPPEAHWFCPKRNDDDIIDYDSPDDAEEDMSSETKHELIHDAEQRQLVAYKYSLILGLAAEVSGQLLEDYTRRLDALLTTCDKCVHNFHLGRKSYLKTLAEQFDDDIVVELSNRLNQVDIARIDRGLRSAQKILSESQPADRNQRTLTLVEPKSLLALYEALCCPQYHNSEELLAKDFNYVFETIQTRKVLRIGDILPAMATFLFSEDLVRARFAKQAWLKSTIQLDSASFEWVVHDALTDSIVAVVQPTTTTSEVQRFWEGFTLILDKIDRSLIAHSLGAMEVQPNIYFLALQHITGEPGQSAEVVQLIINTLHTLLQKAPKDVWSAFGTVSAASIAEFIFKSPGYHRILLNQDNFQNPDESPATKWIPNFIVSQPPVHQYDCCRAILQFLFVNLQREKYPEFAKVACCRAGFQALHATLQTFISSDYQLNPSTSLLVINDIIGLVDKNKDTILGCADIPVHEGDGSESTLKKLAMLVLQDALTLDCKAINAEFHALDKNTPVQRAERAHSQSIWQSVLDIFRPGNTDLAKSILAATSYLTGLDELRPVNKKTPMPEDHIKFNKDFQELMDNVSRVFERLSDFSSSDLKHLCQNSQTARPLFAALVSAHQGTYEATVELVKAMTREDGKEEAISSLLDQALVPVLNSVTFAISRIRSAKNFGPIPNMIKTSGDILKALCGNTGLLRARPSLSSIEQNSVITWWTSQWRVLDMVFSTLEAWSPRIQQPTTYMQDFCRDGMEYAEALFDEYTVVASSLKIVISIDDDLAPYTSGPSKESLRKILEIVCQNVNGLTNLLRLRDMYLIGVITSLLGKLLRSLGEYQLEVDEHASKFIKDACKGDHEVGFKRTNLTNQQKAELQRALYEHQGLEIVEVVRPSTTIKKQATIDSWSKSADGHKHEPTFPKKSQTQLQNSMQIRLAAHEKIKAENAAKDLQTNAFRENRRKAEEERKRANAQAVAKARGLRGLSTVKGEGSGLNDIGGVAGKDHAPIRSEIMVGSDDSDSDDDDDVDESNSLVKSRKEKSKKVSEYEENRARALKQMNQGPVKKTKVQRSAKDLRARVEPNMDALYIEILNWDIFHQGDEPPSTMECRKIADQFYDLSLYKQTFAPLLISEVWRSLVTARDENNLKPVEVTVLNRLSVDKFMEVSTNVPQSQNRDLKFNERDIVLLSRSNSPMDNQQEPHCLARVDRTNNKKGVVEVTFRISRDCDKEFLPCLGAKSRIHAVKIADMTTTQREYAALSSLEYYDLCQEVLSATPSPLQKYSPEKTSGISARYNLNRGQAQAVLSAHDNDGFTLIQGPPGSGKTKTIVAMVGALLTQSLHQQQVELSNARPHVNGKAPTPKAPKKKLLICAPSNAAVDELVLRLKDGIQPLTGAKQKISVIRLGRADAINASVKDVMLDELVRVKLEGDSGEKNKIISDRDKLHQDAAKIKELLNELRPQLEQARGKEKAHELTLQKRFDELKRSQAHVGARIDADKQSGNTVSRQNEINRRRYQQEILDGAHVICGTLSGSGHDMFRNLNVEFETVLIDEAAQCIELSALIPLKYGCSKCILVGDPEQLPPTVLSRSAQSFGYEQSLFVRMQKNHPNDVHLLDTQYRMHPDISRFPSKQFYGGRLLDGDGMAQLRDKPWHESTTLGPYRFFDVKGVQTKESRGHSFINIPELNAAIKLYERLKADYKNVNFKGMIGIIATYKAQLNELKSRFAAMFGDQIFEEIEFNTTDAFQGREREIIIFSCVRATQTGGIGFLKDIRRMNVGLTRAKSSLWVLGDSRSLYQGEFWSKLIDDAKARNRYTGGDVLQLLSKPTARDRKPDRDDMIIEPQVKEEQTTAQRQPSVIIKDGGSSDVEMIDAPSVVTSRKPSLGTTGTSSGIRPKANLLGIRKASRILVGARSASPLVDHSTLGKRQRESSTDEDLLPKKDKTEPPAPKTNPLEEALAAREAARSAQPARPPRPPGVPPPRRRPPVDPFIKKKPPRK